MFERAARLKLRFDSSKGSLSVEELWDLPLSSTTGKASLDGIAIALHRQLETDNVSFVNDDEKPDPALQLRFELVKHVIAVKKAEYRTATEARARAEQKQKILSIIARKEEGELEGKSLDELRQLIGSL